MRILVKEEWEMLINERDSVLHSPFIRSSSPPTSFSEEVILFSKCVLWGTFISFKIVPWICRSFVFLIPVTLPYLISTLSFRLLLFTFLWSVLSQFYLWALLKFLCVLGVVVTYFLRTSPLENVLLVTLLGSACSPTSDLISLFLLLLLFFF